VRLHPSRHARIEEIPKRSAVAGRPRGRALEDIFQIVVVVAIQPPNAAPKVWLTSFFRLVFRLVLQSFGHENIQGET
jgi:hypothetical protein